jgi:glycosyltransferase involved in cell wall biosynthesis
MRILNVTQSYAPFYEFGGPPTKVRALSEGLVKRGHHVTVLTADWGVSKRVGQSVEEGRMDESDHGWRIRNNGVEAIYLKNALQYRALSWNPAIFRFLKNQLETFDVAHIFGLYDLLGPAVARSCGRQQIPYAVEPIGMYVPIVRNIALKRAYHRFFGDKMIRGAKAVIATSEQEISELVAAGIPRDKIVLRRNGVEIPEQLPERGQFRARHGIGASVKLVLYLGRLSLKKSPDLLLKAFAQICGKHPEISFRLIISGPDEDGMRARLERAAADAGITEYVTFLGGMFGEDKWSAYRDADVFVLPSQNENFGNTAVEAIGAGTPVIVTDRCGVAPFIETAGMVVKHEQHELCSVLERVLLEPGLQERFRAGCAAVIAQLGWEQPVAEMETLYRGML